MSDVIDTELLKRAGCSLTGRAFKRGGGGESTEGGFEFRACGAPLETVWLTLPKDGVQFEAFGRLFSAPPADFAPESEVLCFIGADDKLTILKGTGAGWTRKEMGEHGGPEEMNEVLRIFGACTDPMALLVPAFITGQTALLVNPPAIEGDVRNELSTLVADAPGEVNKMMKTILALSRIRGGEGLYGCDGANELAERLNEMGTQIVKWSLQQSLVQAKSPVRASPGGESNASLLNDGSIQV